MLCQGCSGGMSGLTRSQFILQMCRKGSAFRHIFYIIALIVKLFSLLFYLADLLGADLFADSIHEFAQRLDAFIAEIS